MLNNTKVGFFLASNTILRSNKKTALLTILVLMLIFVNLIFLHALVNGMQSLFIDVVTDYVYGDITIEPMEEKLYIESSDSLLKKINSINGVQASTKRLIAGGTITYKEKFVGVNILGIIPEQELSISKFHEVIKEGDFLSRLSSNEIVLGAYVSGEEEGPEILKGLGGIKAGTIVNVTYSNGITKQYKVKGIFKGGSEVSDTIALVNYKELESVLRIENKDKASSIIIKAADKENTAMIKQELLDLGVKEKIDTWQEKIKDTLKDAMRIFDMFTISSRIIGIIIAVFVLFIIIYIDTVNKRKQIGILKAIGISPESIVISRVFMSVFYTISGILLGGIFLFLLITYFNANPIKFYESMVIIPKIDYSIVFQGIVTLVITSIIAGLIPAWLVTREPILKAIWGR